MAVYDKLLTGLSIEACKEACYTETEFVCQTAQLDVGSMVGQCQLSSLSVAQAQAQGHVETVHGSQVFEKEDVVWSQTGIWGIWVNKVFV